MSMNLPISNLSPEAYQRAQPHDIGTLFSPKSIAVIGASSDPTRFSGKIVPTLLRHGFPGNIYPINPGRPEVNGLKTYPSLGEVPGSIDCVVFGIAASQIMPVLEQCAQKQVKLLVIASAGFAESGTPEGKALQQDVADFARRHGIRVLGPNCIGFGNFGEHVFVTAAAVMEWQNIPVGRIGLVSQSGGLGLATLMYGALEEGISFSHVISTGNEADLDTIDVARFFVEDPATDVIAMTIEAVKDSATFIDLLQSAGEAGKPVVVLKSGRSDLGKTMAASHTGALAGSAAVFEMVCRQYGVTCAHDVDDFYQIASMFAKLRASGKLGRFRNPGAHCAALSVSGGHVGLFADHGSLADLAFPAYSSETRDKIAKTLGFEGVFQNPLDTTARVIGDDGFWGRCSRVLLEDPSIQVVVPIITVAHTYEPAIRDFIALSEEQEKIIVTLWAGGSFVESDRRLLSESLVPAFRTPARAAAGVRALDGYCQVWNDPERRPKPVAGSARSSAAARRLLQEAAASGRHALTERESKEVLARIGVPVTREAPVTSAREAVVAARSIGYPVVMKGEHPDILHKSEAGLVLLGIGNDDAAEAAFGTLMQRMAAHTTDMAVGRVLVQEMAAPQQEMILGVTTDPEFGPVVMFGLGGIFVEILKDVSMRLPPFDKPVARRMIEELRSLSVLKGARGKTPVDLDRIADILTDFSLFVAANRDLIQEVDINPLAVIGDSGHDFRALDALIVLKGAGGQKQETSHGH